MDLDGQLKLGHLLFKDRVCRTCKLEKNLIEDFYKTRKGYSASAYSYECKQCTKKRVSNARFADEGKWAYPDW